MAMGADYSFLLISIEIYAPQYKWLNKSFLGSLPSISMVCLLMRSGSFGMPISAILTTYSWINMCQKCASNCGGLWVLQNYIKKLCKEYEKIVEVVWKLPAKYFLPIQPISRDIHIECSKQFNITYPDFYVSGQSRPFWKVLKLL